MNIEINKHLHSNSVRKSDSEQGLCLVSEGKWRGTIDVCNMKG